MIDCPYNNTCIKAYCDLSCGEYSELLHWCNRCDITITNPVMQSKQDDILLADAIIQRAIKDKNNTDSNFTNISVYKCKNTQYMADLISYTAICRYCKGIGFYNGVYKLNFSKYLDEIKHSWNGRNESDTLENMNLWINSSKFLIIYNLGLVRFGDFESQTILNIFQERYEIDKYTMIVLDEGKYGLNGKQDSLFYHKFKDELVHRGVRL